MTLAGAWAALSLLSSAWAIATPLAAAPDEPAHLIKAASVVRGEFIGEPGPDGNIVEVPQYVAFTHVQTCYAFPEPTTADCIPEVPGDPTRLMDAATTAGLYNPVYYVLVGWPLLLASDSAGVFAVRIVSGILGSLFFACAFALIAGWRRPLIPTAAFAIAITPMVLFLNGTVNPNSVEIGATLAAFTGVLTIVRERETRSIAVPAAIVLASAAIAANMRGLSLVWLAIALLTPLLLLDRARLRPLLRLRAVRVTAIGVAGAAILAAVWVFSTNSLGAALDDPPEATAAPAVGTSPVFGFVWTLFSTFHYAQGMIGTFGWLDTPSPDFVYFVWSLLGGGIVFLAVVLLRGRMLVVVVLLTTALLLLPPFLQGYYITNGGIIWQGRYILPIFVCLIVAAGAGLSDRLTLSVADGTRLLAATLGLVAFAHFQSFATALRRYAVGPDAGWLELLRPEWSPPGGVWLSLIAFGLVVAGSGVGVFVLARDRTRQEGNGDRRPLGTRASGDDAGAGGAA